VTGDDQVAVGLSYLVNHGLKLLPGIPGAKRPYVKSGEGHCLATSDVNQFQEWMNEYKDAELLCATGPSRLVVIDCDLYKPGGDEALASLRSPKLPPTPVAMTPRGGMQIFFRCPEGVAIKSSAGVFAPTIDIRARGGLVVLPPAEGRKWDDEFSIDRYAIAPLPAHLLERLIEKETTLPSTDATNVIPEGQRNVTLTKIAGAMRRQAAGPDTIRTALLTENRQRCVPPLPEAEVIGIADGVSGYKPPKQSALVVSWNEFLDEEDEAVTSLWGDALIVPGGSYTILGGSGGVGKTILWTNLIFALASGQEEFLGLTLPGRAVRVLLMEAEGSRTQFRRRLRHVARQVLGIDSRDLPIVFPTKDAVLQIADPSFPRMIEKSGAEFVLLDPITAFHEGEDNSNSDWRRHVRNPLAPMAKLFGTAYGLSDHYGKPSESREGRHKLIGASAKVNDAGAAMRLEWGKGGQASRILFFDRVRDGALPDPPVVGLAIDVLNGTITVDESVDAEKIIAEPLDDVRAEDTVSIITSCGGTVSYAHIKESLMKKYEIKAGAAEGIISVAKRKGLIENAMRGWYRVVEPEP
jgi:hypothetical protein